MKVLFNNKFEKQVDKIRNTKFKNNISEIVKLAIKSNNIIEIPNIKKLTGYSNAYRIRIGNYRIGIFIENDTIIFSVIEHRKDIYKNFP